MCHPPRFGPEITASDKNCSPQERNKKKNVFSLSHGGVALTLHQRPFVILFPDDDDVDVGNIPKLRPFPDFVLILLVVVVISLAVAVEFLGGERF